jgi:class 3 adenylate cyclase
VLVTNEVHDAAKGDYHWSKAGVRRFKGIREPVGLMRVRRAGYSADEQQP